MALSMAMMNAIKSSQIVDLSWVNSGSASSNSADTPSAITVSHRKEVTPESVDAQRSDSVASLDSRAKEPHSDIKRLNDVEGINPKFIEVYEKLAKRMGISPPPPVYVKDSGDVGLSAGLTKKGEPVIVMSSKDLLSKPDEVLSAMAHELQHIINGDGKTHSIVEQWNHDKTGSQIYDEMIKRELGADNGVAVLCDPSAFKRRRESSFQEEGHILMKDMDSGEVSKIKRPTSHPSDLERMKTADELPKNTEGCIAVPPDLKSIVVESKPALSPEEQRRAEEVFKSMGIGHNEIVPPRIPTPSEKGATMGR